MILEIAGAAVLVALIVMVARMEGEVGRLQDSVRRIAEALERSEASSVGKTGAASVAQPSAASHAPAQERDQAWIAAAIAAASLVARPRAMGVPGAARTSDASGASGAPAERGSRFQHVPAAYDGYGSGFIDVLGHDEPGSGAAAPGGER